MREAEYYIKMEGNLVICNLCPHNCKIESKKTGFCGSRENSDGVLYSRNYGVVSSINLDPIEKKPLYHFFPGKGILSLGTIGCNLRCNFCQNHEISQARFDDKRYVEYSSFTPEQILERAIALKSKGNIGVAYTYNEPIIWFEYMKDIALLIKDVKMQNVVVTNGYINPKPLQELFGFIDAFNVDLKAFTDKFYKEVTMSDIESVKNTLINIRKGEKHLEITTLVIPTLNDEREDFEKMVDWIYNKLGKDTVLHLSRYFPRYRQTIYQTSVEKLVELHEIAAKKLNYVYIGNVISDFSNTYCPKCKRMLVDRNWNRAVKAGLDRENRCISCKEEIPIKG